MGTINMDVTDITHTITLACISETTDNDLQLNVGQVSGLSPTLFLSLFEFQSHAVRRWLEHIWPLCWVFCT